jgi:hypothetical protein
VDPDDIHHEDHLHIGTILIMYKLIPLPHDQEDERQGRRSIDCDLGLSTGQDQVGQQRLEHTE